MGWIIAGVVACVLFGWYLYHRSRKEKDEDTDQAEDAEENVDEYEDLLLTGLMLNEIYDDEEDGSSDDVESMDDGGFDDSGGLES